MQTGHGNNDTHTSSPFQTDHDNDSSDQAQVSVDDSGEEQPPSYAGIIVGIFFGIFIVMLVIAFFGYRDGSLPGMIATYSISILSKLGVVLDKTGYRSIRNWF